MRILLQKTKNKSNNYKKLFPYFGSSSHIIDLLFIFSKKLISRNVLIVKKIMSIHLNTYY